MAARDRYLSRRHDLRLVPSVAVVWAVSANGWPPTAIVVCGAVLGAVAVAVSLWARRWMLPARLCVAADVVALAAIAAAAALVRVSASGGGARATAAGGVGRGAHGVFDIAFGDGAAELRAQLAQLVSTFGGQAPGLIAGMSVGDTSAISPNVDVAMRAASLGHVTAVSGANCVVAVALGVGLATLCGCGRTARIVAGLAALIAFVAIVGAQPTVLRAGLMVALVLAARLVGMSAGGISVLAATALALLLIDPTLSSNIGFGLSASATAGLILLAMPLGDGLARWMPPWLGQLIALPVAAQLACLPLLVVLGSGASLGAVVANMLVAPVTGVVTLLGLLACLCVGVAPPVATLLCALAWPFTEWTAAVASFFAQTPVLRLVWPDGIGGVCAAAAVGIVAVGAALWPRRRGRFGVAALALAVAVSGHVVGGAIGVDATMPTSWQVAACDVGQGDGLVFRSGDSAMVVDVGADGDRMLGCLGRLGITHIDVLVVTHWDTDHAGGAARVASRIHPTLTVSSTRAPGVATFDALAHVVPAVSLVARGDRVRAGAIDARVLWPAPGFTGDDNNKGVVLLINTGPVRTLALADVGREVQARLIPDVQGTDIGVLKVSHHGSADYSPSLYQAVAAPVGLVSVGASNRYGHPRAEVLATLTQSGTRAVRTDESGIILVSAGEGDGGDRLWCERSCR